MGISGRYLVQLGAEEALFLVYNSKCLHVYKGFGVKDAWFKFLSGTSFPLCYVSGDELLHYFISKCSCFPHRYLSYLHFKSKGWIIRPGKQFGTDFLLYQSHPIISHSSFALTVIPTAI